ncbi:MAG: hypothetical protein A2148_07250 [Chloroflexi bacterium RBG_16_68_14]|nr:MAG: hypothetical protein A2148_07250 [Chloroflexi bacterium RBG_16_68_14]
MAKIERSEAEHGLTKDEACRILQVAPSADEGLVTQAYWHHASKLRVLAPRDPEARRQLDELNRAYLVLSPAQSEAPLSNEVPPVQQEPSFAEEVVGWLRRLVEQTQARCPEHVPEVTTLTVTTTLLTFLALSAGASPLWTVLIAAIAAAVIWAPWRRI